MRSRGALAALGPAAATAGALLGFGLGLGGTEGVEWILKALVRGEGWGGVGFAYFVGAVMTLWVHGLGQLRTPPLHAGKAAAGLAAAALVPAAGIGHLAATLRC